MCFDKTGTLTEESLDVMGIRIAYKGNFHEENLKISSGIFILIFFV